MGCFLIATVWVVMLQELKIKMNALNPTRCPIWMKFQTPNCTPNNCLAFQILDGVQIQLHLSKKYLNTIFLQVKLIQ